MADNYLEKRMDDYRNGRLSSTRKTSKLTPTGTTAGRVGFQLAVKRVFIAMKSTTLRDAIFKGFAEVGCKVAFCGMDRVAGTESAQRYGMMFCPVERLESENVEKMCELVEKRWHGIDLLITDIPLLHCPDNAKLLIVASADSYEKLRETYSAPYSSIVYCSLADSELSEELVKPIVDNVLLQGCNADSSILTELNIRLR